MRKVRAVAVAVCVGLVLSSAGGSAGGFDHTRFAAVAGLPPAEPCPGAIGVKDASNDTRSWALPAPPGATVIRPSADLRRFELRATKAGVCVRWTTAAPAPPGTDFVFLARGPWFREPGGAQTTRGYGFDLELRKNGARATYGLARLSSNAPHVLRVRAGQTGSVVSAFLRKAWLLPPANMPGSWSYVYRTFSFEARVLSVPDSKGNRRVDFIPQEEHIVQVVAIINGHLCGPPCHDPRFFPH